MQDLIATKIFLEEDTGSIKKAKIGLDIQDIHFYEEYVGDILADYTKTATVLHLYSGEKMCITKSFEEVRAIVQRYRDLKTKESFFKFN